MMGFDQLELKIIYHAVYQLAMSEDKEKMDSDYLSVQRLTDEQIDGLTVTIRHKLSRVIKDTADDYIM